MNDQISNPTLAAAPLPAAVASSRNEALDWTKGALVVCMVIYHAINYSAFRPDAFRYLGFLPPSFILIAGFLVGQVYALKYDLRSWQPYVRLGIRGLKLLLLFSALNVLYCVALEHGVRDGIGEFGERSGAIFLSGNGREGIFQVLLPIAYFLLLAPVLLWLRARTSAAIAISAAVIFLLCFGLERTGNTFENLDLLSVGIVGMAFGLIPMAAIDRLASRWIPVLTLYVLHHLLIYWRGEDYALQVLGAIVTILLLYCCALHLNLKDWLGREMILLGKYSLLGYLAQIALLQVIVKCAGGQPSHRSGVAVVSVITLLLTVGIVRAVHGLRQKNRAVAAVYKTIFA